MRTDLYSIGSSARALTGDAHEATACWPEPPDEFGTVARAPVTPLSNFPRRQWTRGASAAQCGLHCRHSWRRRATRRLEPAVRAGQGPIPFVMNTLCAAAEARSVSGGERGTLL